MIEYLINDTNGSIIFFQDQAMTSRLPVISHVKKFCQDALFTYEGYIKCVKKKVKEKYQIPVVIHETLALFSTCRVRDYENIWINYYAIKDYHEIDGTIEIMFYSGKRLYLKSSLNKFENKIKLLMKIKKIK